MRTRRPRSRFVPRSIFETALVAVVPTLTACASRQPSSGVAYRTFEQQTVAAQFASPEETTDAGGHANEASDVIDGGASVADSSATYVVEPNLGVGPPLPVAYQGFTNEPSLQPPAGPTDAGSRPRSRRR